MTEAATTLPTTAMQAITLLASCTFRSFTSHDWAAFAGAESADPQICERDDGITVLVDGNRVEFHLWDAEGGCQDATFDFTNMN